MKKDLFYIIIICLILANVVQATQYIYEDLSLDDNDISDVDTLTATTITDSTATLTGGELTDASGLISMWTNDAEYGVTSDVTTVTADWTFTGSVTADYVNITNDLTVTGNSTLGTVISGIWQGTAIDEAYLDSDLVTVDETATFTDITINTTNPVSCDHIYAETITVSGDYTFPTATGTAGDVLTVSSDTTQLYFVGRGLWEIDMSGDLMPVTSSYADNYWELDVNDDLQPQS